MATAVVRVTMTHEEWKAEAVRRFGPDMSTWRFVCPVCGHTYSVAEGDAANMQGAIGFSCIGRYVGAKRDALGGNGAGPCNYAGGGLFKLNPVTVVMPDGDEITAMAFAG